MRKTLQPMKQYLYLIVPFDARMRQVFQRTLENVKCQHYITMMAVSNAEALQRSCIVRSGETNGLEV